MEKEILTIQKEVTGFIDSYGKSVSKGTQEKVSALLLEGLPRISIMKQTAISDTENPRESLLNYMSECIKLFISTISQIDPTLSNQELFEKNYKELLRSFLDDISQHPLLSSMSKDEKRIIIKKAVEIASKQV